MGYEPTWYEYLFFLGPWFVMGVGTFLGAFFGVSFALRRWSSPKSREPGQSAIEIVRSRYALGEISRSEYERMRDDLGAETAFGSNTPIKDA